MSHSRDISADHTHAPAREATVAVELDIAFKAGEEYRDRDAHISWTAGFREIGAEGSGRAGVAASLLPASNRVNDRNEFSTKALKAGPHDTRAPPPGSGRSHEIPAVPAPQASSLGLAEA